MATEGMCMDTRAPHKKAPLGSSCLDAFQVWQTEGARSRNHKKLRFGVRPLPWFTCTRQGHTFGTSSGPWRSVFTSQNRKQVPSGTNAAPIKLSPFKSLPAYRIDKLDTGTYHTHCRRVTSCSRMDFHTNAQTLSNAVGSSDRSSAGGPNPGFFGIERGLGKAGR